MFVVIVMIEDEVPLERISTKSLQSSQEIEVFSVNGKQKPLEFLIPSIRKFCIKLLEEGRDVGRNKRSEEGETSRREVIYTLTYYAL